MSDGDIGQADVTDEMVEAASKVFWLAKLERRGDPTMGDLRAALKAALAAAWVPCAERMPGEFEDVLAATGDQERPVVVAHWQPNRETGMNDWFTADMVPTDVFAWMPLPPLPAPPKE